jgi:hypothetical protein
MNQMKGKELSKLCLVLKGPLRSKIFIISFETLAIVIMKYIFMSLKLIAVFEKKIVYNAKLNRVANCTTCTLQ